MIAPRFFSFGEICLRGGVIEHAAIHRGRNHQRTLRRQRRDRQQIIGNAVCELCHRIRCAGRNDKQIRCFAKADMQDVRFIAPQVFIRISAATRYRLKGKRRDEFFPRASQDHIH